MDEADRILNLDFEVELTKILRCIPSERRTMLFSATMTKKVAKLQRASLKDPVKVERRFHIFSVLINLNYTSFFFYRLRSQTNFKLSRNYNNIIFSFL